MINITQRLRLPDGYPEHRTETSFMCVQVVFCSEPIGMLEVQSNSEVSVPVQVRLLIQIGPLLLPKRAPLKYSDSIFVK